MSWGRVHVGDIVRRLVSLGHSKQSGVRGVMRMEIREMVGVKIPQNMWA